MSSTQYVDVNRTLQNLEDSSLHPNNTQAVRDFLDHCAAQGISEVRQQRYAQSWKALIQQFAPDGFQLYDASEQELKTLIAGLNRSPDYAKTSKETMRSAVKKFYKFANGGHEHPDKVKFFTIRNGRRNASSVSREDLFTTDELKRLLRGFSSTRDRAFTLMLYESGCRPGELLSRNIRDFTSNEKGDFIYLEGSKETPDRTNQLVRAGRTVREWLVHHPLGGALGDIDDPSAPLWVKTEQQTCLHCGEIPHQHGDDCTYEPDLRDRLNYGSFLRRFKAACETAEIPANKRRPYNLRHTRLTEVATFMGYEQLNKFAGWVPGSSRAKVYVHLNNEDVNKAIRDQYGLDDVDTEEQSVACPFCDTTNQAGHSECRRCGRPLSLEQQVEQEEDLSVLERLQKLDEKGVLDKLDQLETLGEHASADRRGET